jgi:hypothetical protein
MRARTGSRRLARSIVLLAGAVGVLATTPALRAQQTRPAAPAIDPRAAAQRLGYSGPADFSHRRHRALECTACHTSEGEHGALRVRTITDCQSCHHAPERQSACASCHTAAELRAPRAVTTTMRMSVWNAPRQRALPFPHERHSSVTCTTCHTTPVTLAAARDCASCHQQHHVVEATCRTCHTPSPRAQHTREAHLGCAGSGCHTLQGTVALAPVRNVCLTCHQDMVNHNPGRQCAACHQVSWQPTAVNPTRRGSQ